MHNKSLNKMYFLMKWMPIDFTNVSILKVNNFSYFSQTERKEVLSFVYKRILLDLHYNGVVGTC